MKIPGAEEASEHIGSWAARGRWKEECRRVLNEHLEPVCAKAGIDEDELAELLGEQHYQMIQACAFEDFLCRRLGPKNRNVIDDYLDQRAWKESIPGRDYLRVLRDSVMSLYEVVEVKPGRGLVLRDLIRGGAPVEVDERMGSESLVGWDLIAARILTIGGRGYLSGAVLHFPREPAEAVKRIFRDGPERARRSMPNELPSLTAMQRRAVDDVLGDKTVALEVGTRVFSSVWLAYTIGQLTSPPPSLNNFDGEQIVLTKVRFALAKENMAKVTGLLDATPELSREPEELCWQWHRQDGKETNKKTDSGLSLASWDETGALVLGRIELRGKWLVLEVNSLARANHGKQMIGQLLGGLVGAPVTETQSVESALEEHRGRKRSPAKETAPPIPPEAAARVMKEFLDRHYRRVIEEPLPAIGNVSPRSAVGTQEGREKVIGWLKDMENGESLRSRKEGTPPYDFTWMWQELGVLGERR
jgi:hypothetical protein